jgi:hypothetical protein
MKNIADRLKRLVWSDFKVCKSVTVLQLIVVTTSGLLVNPISNPNPVLVTNTRDCIFTILSQFYGV